MRKVIGISWVLGVCFACLGYMLGYAVKSMIGLGGPEWLGLLLPVFALAYVISRLNPETDGASSGPADKVDRGFGEKVK